MLYNNKIIKHFLLIIALIILVSCTDLFCGKLNGEWDKKYIYSKQKYKIYLSLENIPCEFSYINVKLKNIDVDTTLIKNLHNDIYDSEKKIGWEFLQIYDYNGNYLFTHSYKSGISVRTGD